MTDTSAFSALGDERYVSLTTFRQDGTPVSTPVWVARDGDDLLVTTPDGSGKVKRLRQNGTVRLQPCGRRGGVKDGTVPIGGRAEVRSTSEEHENAHRFRDKYGVEYRIFMLIERIIQRGNSTRLLLRIRPE